MDYQCTHKNVFQIIQDHFQLSLDAQLEILEKQIALNSSESFSISSEAKNSLIKLLCKIKARRQKEHRKNDVFLESNKNWLKTAIRISVINLTNFWKTRVVGQDGQFNVIFLGILANLYIVSIFIVYSNF